MQIAETQRHCRRGFDGVQDENRFLQELSFL
jgi:hypothetical protein